MKRVNIKKSGEKNRLRKNPTAIFVAIILMISAFLFPISKINIFGTSTADRNYVLFNLIEDIFSNFLNLEGALQILPFLMSITFILLFFMYLLNGFGLINNKYSRKASYLTFLYLFFGLWLINKLNLEYGSPTVGTISNYTGVGAGIYVVPILGVLYIIFKRSINSKIKI